MGKLADEQKIALVKDYIDGEYTLKELGFKYNIHATSVRSILRIRNVSIKDRTGLRRKYSLDEHYFDKIDTEEKAYFLGLLYADGYNSQASHYIKVELQEKDYHILQKFADLVSSDAPITLRKKKKESHQNTYVVKFCSKIMSDALARLGCIQAKSLILQFPTAEQVSRDLIRHFIRGYFDGDGCLYIKRQKESQISFSCGIVSSLDFCIGLSEYIGQLLGIVGSISRINTCGEYTRRFTLSGTKKAFILTDWIYRDCSISIDRKMETYLTIKKILLEKTDTPKNLIYAEMPKHSLFRNLLLENNFNHLKVVKYIGFTKNSKNNRHFWLCQCDCGNFKEVRTDHITRGVVKSCGCICGRS